MDGVGLDFEPFFPDSKIAQFDPALQVYRARHGCRRLAGGRHCKGNGNISLHTRRSCHHMDAGEIPG